MLKTDSETFRAVLLAGILFLTLSLIIIYVIISYKRRQQKHYIEIEAMHEDFEEQLIQTRFEVQEHTRKNLAADLHDNIGQVLSLTNVTLASINFNDPEKAKQKIADTQELVTRSIRELRQLSKIIHGEQLVKLGLIETIQQEVKWLERNGHYTVDFVYELPDLDIRNTDKDLFIYRLLQESLNNIIKHSGANQVQILLQFAAHTMQMTVTDNGTGFNTEKVTGQQGGLGLSNMQKRVSILCGSMDIVSSENNGTTLTFSIPYP